MADLDFKYRGEYLSNYEYIICEFSSSNSADVVNTDSQRAFTSISMFAGKRQPILYSTYNDTLVMKFSICKMENAHSQFISPDEAAEIKRWLCSPVAQELQIIDDDFWNYRWFGFFNVNEIHIARGCIGFELTFTSVAPFGYKKRFETSGTVEANGTIEIDDTSDEEGYIYPDMVITVKTAGDLTITNSFDDRKTVIKNCTQGEVLKFSNLLQISSSDSTHIIGNDFNYKFLRINNEYEKTKNTLKFSLNCDYSISYNPIAKVVFV